MLSHDRKTFLVANCIGAFFSLLITSFLATAWWSSNTPSIILSRIEVLNPVVNAGGELLVRVSFERIRYCSAVVRQWIYDGQEVERGIRPMATEPRPLIKTSLVLSIPVANASAIGDARYLLLYTGTCPYFFDIFTTEKTVSAELEFKIEPKIAKSE